MQNIKLLIVLSLAALLALSSCKKEDPICPQGKIETISKGLAKVQIDATDGRIITVELRGQVYNYNSCEVGSMYVSAGAEGVKVKVNGTTLKLEPFELKEITNLK